MAKRFSETKIWDDEWYQELPIVWKIVWQYICARCDEAGIWKSNFKLANFQIGAKIIWEDADKFLNNGKIRVVITGQEWFIKEFISFQYGDKVWESDHAFHKKIRKMVEKYQNINFDRVSDRVSHTLQEKEKDKVKEKEIKALLNNTNIIPPKIEDVRAYCLERNNGIDAQRFIDYYSARGWMLGKNKIKDWKACVRTWERNSDSQAPNLSENAKALIAMGCIPKEAKR